MKNMFLYFVSLVTSVPVLSQTVDLEKSIVFGPGLNGDFHMPVRYFFVHLFDSSGKRLNVSPGEDYLSAKALNPDVCRAWFQVIDGYDGTFIVRYKLFASCQYLKFELIANESATPIGESPYYIKGPLFCENCFCPRSLETWLSSMSCNCGDYSRLKFDLEHFMQNGSIDFSAALSEAQNRWATHPGAYSFCHYQIINNQVYRKCYGQHVGFNMFSDSILLSLTRKVILPNTEFLINLGDWPLEKKYFVPVFSWCGSDDSKDIVLPTYDITESTLEMMGRNSLDIFSVRGMLKVPWASKIEKAFWRGRDSRQERLDLVKLSKNHSDLLDVGLTRFFFFRDVMHLYGPEVPTVPFNEFFQYKYLINIDGTVAAYRLPYLLAGNSLVFMHDSMYYEHFYKALRPWVHYVPFKKDLSDLIEKILWARNHDEEAQQICRNAQQFVQENLLPSNLLCYYVHAVTNYTKILQKPPFQATDEMELVKQPSEALNCLCEKSAFKEEL